MTEQLPPGLPPETVPAYTAYLEAPVTSRPQLRRMLDTYLRQLRDASGENEFLDTDLARRLADGLLSMLEQADDDRLAHVQAAVRYFVETEDVEHDLQSMLGFDDDAQVFNAVCRHLGRPEWEVTL